MPLLRYFVFAGAGLLAALLIVSSWLPAPAPAEHDAHALDKTTIRINGDKPAYERVTIDTSLPTITPPAVQQSTVAEQDSNREAFAKMDDAAPAAPPVPLKRVAVRKRPKRAVVVMARPAGGLFDLW
jgi:hypothetical protein